MNRRNMSRRAFLAEWLGRLGLGGACAVFGGILLDVWTAAGRFSSDHWVDVASVVSLQRAPVIPFPEHRLALVRAQSSVQVLSLECTHLGCLLNTMDRGFYCPCHGSEFGPHGEVHSGPATQSLPWHPVRRRLDRIWVRTGTKLATPDRIPISPVYKGGKNEHA